MIAVHAGNINFKWYPKNLEKRTLAIERLLEPLVTQLLMLPPSSRVEEGRNWLMYLITLINK
uniref:Uncharacterized protein n=1 Tax=Vombatus ursinus TaxID=29139 RepID=A0A4X2LWM7_VOMUR